MPHLSGPLPVPPPLPPTPATPSAQARKRRLLPFLSLVGVLLVVAALWRVEMLRREANQQVVTAAANQIVAARVETARAHLSRHDFDEALRVLDSALATEHATTLDEARLTLLRA